MQSAHKNADFINVLIKIKFFYKKNQQKVEKLKRIIHNEMIKGNDTMIRIAICDTKLQDRILLKEFLNSYEQESNTKYCLKLFASGEALLQSRFMPHILFLDVVMDHQDGIRIGAEMKKMNADTLIIYTADLGDKITTAMNDVHSFGFFVKPVEKEKIFQILSDALAQIRHIRNRNQEKLRFLSESNTIIHLDPMDIYYFEYVNRKIKIAAKENTFICKGTVREIAAQMETYGFMISHQSFVVNLFHIEKISAQMLVMSNGEAIPLAQKRASAVRKRMMQTVKGTVDE